jgi:sulfite exporter TauE/SafE
MENSIQVLAITAASIGFFHTLTGPDHYIPFAMIAKARQWTTFKTMMLVIGCGIGHVGSSILLGFVGIATGIGLQKLELVEGYRGSLAAWVLIIFGLIYGIWGLRRAIHKHQHKQLNEDHHHSHGMDSTHHHLPKHDDIKKGSITPWILFIIFVLGPCEPLIPMLIYPAAKFGIAEAVYISVIFAVVTILTMMVMAFLLLKGFEFLPMQKIHRYTHAIAGFTIFICGLSIEFLGL